MPRALMPLASNVPILCDQNMTIVAGHTRWKAAKKLGLEKAPVIQLQLTEEQRKAFSIADNKTAEIADWDFPKLREVLDELRSEDIDLHNLGFSDEDLRRILLTEEVDEDELPNVEGEPITQVGDLWVLGKHRLLCDDSKDKRAIKRLTEGIKVNHVYGGPPYFNLREYSHWDDFQSYMKDMQTIMENCCNILADGSIIVWNVGSLSSQNLDLTSHHSIILEKSGFQYLDTIIWMKSGANYSILRNAHIARNHIYYPAFQWEALLVFQKPGQMPKMTRQGVDYMSNHQTNVWEISPVQNRRKDYGHPDVCPVEIPYRSIQAYTGDNATVFEPFGGSGTTLIAAEKSGRQAFLMEQSPNYCDLIVNRWENQTGQEAIRSVNHFEV